MHPNIPPPPHVLLQIQQIKALTAAVEAHTVAAEAVKSQLEELRQGPTRKRGGALAEVTKLSNRKRSEEVTVVVKGSYRVSGYDWRDVVRLSSAVASGELKLPWFKTDHPRYNPDIMIVPRRAGWPTTTRPCATGG